MGTYGKIFKLIRESKNMSLKEVAGGFRDTCSVITL